MIYFAVEALPIYCVVVYYHIAVCAAGFGDRNRTGVKVNVVRAESFPSGNVSMTMQKNIAGLHGRQGR